MTDAERTVAAVRARGWQVVKLRARDKRPAGLHWEITRDADSVARWFATGHNVGLVCGPESGVLVLDPDRIEWADMIDQLGQPGPPWVITGSGRLHYYFAWECDTPAKIEWDGQIIGEVQRGPQRQQVVLPPSTHPATGARYRWITEDLGFLCEPINPVTDPLPALPGLWRAYLRSFVYGRGY